MNKDFLFILSLLFIPGFALSLILGILLSHLLATFNILFYFSVTSYSAGVKKQSNRFCFFSAIYMACSTLFLFSWSYIRSDKK